jgi:translation initiation factor IF-3
MNIRDALKLADSKNLDLVEVAPDANPPVCKIVDYGKFKYELIKKEKIAKKNQKKQELKGSYYQK